MFIVACVVLCLLFCVVLFCDSLLCVWCICVLCLLVFVECFVVVAVSVVFEAQQRPVIHCASDPLSGKAVWKRSGSGDGVLISTKHFDQA